MLNPADKFIEQLKADEGFRAKPYRDTEGLLTIGYGTLLEDGITESEAELLLWHRLRAMIAEFSQSHAGSAITSLPFPRRGVILNMLYNLGPRRLSGFKKMFAAIGQEDWDKAADEMLDSKWAKQVGARATRLAAIMRTGND